MNTDNLQWEAARNPALAQRITGGPMAWFSEERYVAIDGPDQQRAQDRIVWIINEKLRPCERETILALYGKGLSQSEYARHIERSRERVRQMEARALRRFRTLLFPHHIEGLEQSYQVEAVPGGPRDPAWISIKLAARLTNLSEGHIRSYLVKRGLIVSRPHPTKGMRLQVKRDSLKEYVSNLARHGRRKGIWKGDN